MFIFIYNILNKKQYKRMETLYNKKMGSDVQLFEIKNFNSQEKTYYKMINKFIRNLSDEKKEEMVNIINGNSDLSLRILDWIATDYGKMKSIILIDNDEGDEVDLQISYKSQLKTYKKKYFDPFKRDVKKFEYTYSMNKKVITTLCQLNFFRWSFTIGLIDYVKQNLEFLTDQMNELNKNKINKKNKKDSDNKFYNDEECKINESDEMEITFY